MLRFIPVPGCDGRIKGKKEEDEVTGKRKAGKGGEGLVYLRGTGKARLR